MQSEWKNVLEESDGCFTKRQIGAMPGIAPICLLVNDFSEQGGCSRTVYLNLDKISYLVIFSVEDGCAVLFCPAVELFS